MFQLTAEELAGIVAVVVGFTELIKLSKYIPERYGLLIAALTSAIGIAAYASSKPELVFNRFMIWPFVSAFLVVITAAGGVYGIIRSTTGGQVTDASGPRPDGPRMPVWLVAILGGSMLLSACGKSPVVLVGESGVVASTFIESASNAVEAVREPRGPVPSARALEIQEALLIANGDIKKLIPILKAIDAAQQAGDPTAGNLDAAFALVASVSNRLNLVVKGVPVAEATARLLEVVNNARGAFATIQATLEKIRTRKGGNLTPSILELERLMAPAPAVVAAN